MYKIKKKQKFLEIYFLMGVNFSTSHLEPPSIPSPLKAFEALQKN